MSVSEVSKVVTGLLLATLAGSVPNFFIDDVKQRIPFWATPVIGLGELIICALAGFLFWGIGDVLSDVLAEVRRRRAIQAAERMRATTRVPMTEAEIDAEIAAARRERKQ